MCVAIYATAYSFIICFKTFDPLQNNSILNINFLLFDYTITAHKSTVDTFINQKVLFLNIKRLLLTAI